MRYEVYSDASKEQAIKLLQEKGYTLQKGLFGVCTRGDLVLEVSSEGNFSLEDLPLKAKSRIIADPLVDLIYKDTTVSSAEQRGAIQEAGKILREAKFDAVVFEVLHQITVQAINPEKTQYNIIGNI